jgi:hypothetical protein
LVKGYETETGHSNTFLSIYGMGDAPAFVIKGDVPYILNGRRAHFHDKRRHAPSNAYLPLLT